MRFESSSPGEAIGREPAEPPRSASDLRRGRAARPNAASGSLEASSPLKRSFNNEIYEYIIAYTHEDKNNIYKDAY